MLEGITKSKTFPYEVSVAGCLGYDVLEQRLFFYLV